MRPQCQSSTERLITDLLEQAGITPGTEVLHKIETYFEQLQKWNRSMNLTAIKDPQELIIKHLGDTLLMLPCIPREASSLLDIGSGAGVPGLIVKILRPGLEVVLVDAKRKKVSFLKAVIAALGLKGISAEHGRVGDKGVPRQRPVAGFDIITARALASLRKLIRIAAPLLSSKGAILAMKGPKGLTELDEARALIRKLGLDCKVIEGKLPILGHQRIVIVLRHDSSQGPCP